MTKISVSSRICGSRHKITGKIEGDKIVIKIDTCCEKFKEQDSLEFPLHKLPENQRNIIQEMERQVKCSFECTRECALDCTRGCLIPPAVLNVCSIERRLVKKEIVKVELIKAPLLDIAECTASELQ